MVRIIYLWKNMLASPKRGSAIKPLPRVTWLKLAIGAVKGLTFLNQLDRQIISRVFKISNRLLDSVNFTFAT